MSTFSEANQVRLGLKMQFSKFAWYKASHVSASDDDGFDIVISITHLDNNIRKVISPVVDGVSIKTEVEQRKR